MWLGGVLLVKKVAKWVFFCFEIANDMIGLYIINIIIIILL